MGAFDYFFGEKRSFAMKIWKKSVIGCAAALLAMSASAHAADLVRRQPAAIAPLPGEDFSRWQIRVRALTVLPMNQGSVRLNGTRAASSGLNFQDTVTPELDISYFFTKNIAAELILGTTYSKIYGKGKTMDSLGLKNKRLGKTWILPPTLTLQYHFTNFGKFQPYIGGGVNYTFFYSESDWKLKNVTVDGTWGGAVQLGFDYMLTKHWGLNLDVKKLFLAPSYHAKAGDARVTGRARLDPWLIGTGITYRF